MYTTGPPTIAHTLANPTNTTNVYIRGLPPDTDDDKLYEMTSRFGKVISHKAIMDTEHGTCKG
jgi:RNA recognition motif-containing protein